MPVARYHRVSTADQDPRRQLDATQAYVDRECPDKRVRVFVDESTGSDTDRDDYHEMMQAVHPYPTAHIFNT